ncbi:hypothetical protein LBMAG42_30000 [Deltaproteobacteria bacterium]|nr:hypothetical protein LBMAG42_30000 [Deltaproteobacteria bacterium]
MRDPGEERVVVVLSASAYGDDDRILKLLCPERGRIGAFQRGGQRKPQGLDVGVRAKVRLRRRQGGLDTLAGVDLEDPRIHLRRGYGRLVLAQYGCELVGAFSHEEHPEPKLFGLLETLLLLLDALESDPGPAVLAALELKVLTFAGVGPALDRCSVCAGLVDDEMVFDPAAGGARHARCGGGAEVAKGALAQLEDLRRTPLRELVDRPLAPGLEPMAADLVRHQLGHELGSRALLVGL